MTFRLLFKSSVSLPIFCAWSISGRSGLNVLWFAFFLWVELFIYLPFKLKKIYKCDHIKHSADFFVVSKSWLCTHQKDSLQTRSTQNMEQGSEVYCYKATYVMRKFFTMVGYNIRIFSLVQLLSRIQLCGPWTAVCQSSLSFAIT